MQSHWQTYIRHAVDTAGGPTALADKAGIDVATIHRWLRGASTAGRRANVRKVALAIGDDPNNALAAAGLPTDARPASPPSDPPTGIPPLSEQIARIRTLGQRLGTHPLKIAEQIDHLVTVYEQIAAAAPEPGEDNQRTA